MTTPKPLTDAQLRELRIALDFCDKALKKEKTNRCDQPIVGEDDDENPNPKHNIKDSPKAASAKKGQVDLSLMSHWLIRNVPENPGQITPSQWARCRRFTQARRARKTILRNPG